MSAEIQWAAIRTNSAFLVKRDNFIFSSEPGNLMNTHSFKFSGVANNKTVGVSVEGEEGKKRVVVTTKRTRNDASRKPASQLAKTILNKHVVKGKCVGAVAVAGITKGYRADLSEFAVARYHALTKSLRPQRQQKKRDRKRKLQK